MENQTVNLTVLICDSLNSIFFKIFSSMDNTVYSNLDNILFISPNVLNNYNFQEICGTGPNNGILLIANSLFFGIVLFYVLQFTMSHLFSLITSSPYEFIFKSIIFIACANSSLWICEQIIYLISLISDSILELGNLINGSEITFSSLLTRINTLLYPTIETFNIFSFSGFLKICSTIGISYILIIYTIRFLGLKILVLLSPFAFISLINNQFDGFFKKWIKLFLITLSIQIFVALTLVLGFSLDFISGDVLSELIYLAIIMIIANFHRYLINANLLKEVKNEFYYTEKL